MFKLYLPNGHKWNIEQIGKWITHQETHPLLHAAIVGNASVTTISASNTHYKVNIPYLINPNSRGFVLDGLGGFVHTDTEHSHLMELTAVVSLTSGNNQDVAIHFARNDIVLGFTEARSTTTGIGKAENITTKSLLTLSSNDVMSLWVENKTSASNITVTNVSILLRTA